ncbi:hypothetical protein F5883DRAFT_179475 [Diaporthe sp. PMI_573]|nr:hypothetical protein F5883DRAFT_179475 [Diaporthaceae sp. PMI_573]
MEPTSGLAVDVAKQGFKQVLRLARFNKPSPTSDSLAWFCRSPVLKAASSLTKQLPRLIPTSLPQQLSRQIPHQEPTAAMDLQIPSCDTFVEEAAISPPVTPSKTAKAILCRQPSLPPEPPSAVYLKDGVGDDFTSWIDQYLTHNQSGRQRKPPVSC